MSEPRRDEPGRDLENAGYDSSLGDESTGGAAARQAAGAAPGGVTAPQPEQGGSKPQHAKNDEGGGEPVPG